MYSIYPLYTSRSSLSLRGNLYHYSYLSISILYSQICPLWITSSDHSTAIPLFTPFITLGLPSYYEVIRLALKWIISQYHLGFTILDNRIIIDYVANRTYILTASKTRRIQVNYLLNQGYKFR